jgi:hypothetical protein
LTIKQPFLSRFKERSKNGGQLLKAIQISGGQICTARYNQQYQRILKESERLSLHFTDPQNSVNVENDGVEHQPTNFNRSLHSLQKVDLDLLAIKRCAMYNGIILLVLGYCCRRAQPLRTPTQSFGGVLEKFRIRNQKTIRSIDGWTGGFGDGDDGSGRHSSFTDPFAIAAAIAWVVFA